VDPPCPLLLVIFVEGEIITPRIITIALTGKVKIATNSARNKYAVATAISTAPEMKIIGRNFRSDIPGRRVIGVSRP
jgi:hypothetical protein